MTYAALTAVLLGAFWASPNIAWIQWLLVAAVGFALYGPQMLIGLCGAEVVPKPAVSAAQGFLGWISYLGKLHPLLSSICVQDQRSVSMAFKGGLADVWAHRHGCMPSKHDQGIGHSPASYVFPSSPHPVIVELLPAVAHTIAVNGLAEGLIGVILQVLPTLVCPLPRLCRHTAGTPILRPWPVLAESFCCSWRQ